MGFLFFDVEICLTIYFRPRLLLYQATPRRPVVNRITEAGSGTAELKEIGIVVQSDAGSLSWPP